MNCSPHSNCFIWVNITTWVFAKISFHFFLDFRHTGLTTHQNHIIDLSGVEVVAFDDIGALYLALEAGDVDGVITDLVGNQGYVDDTGGAMVIESYATDEFYGFAVQEEGAEDLLAAVNESLAKLQGNGTYDAIYAEWFPGA